MSKVDIGVIMNTNKVKYSLLEPMIKEVYHNKNSNEVYMYLDVYSIIMQLVKNNEISYGYNALCSGIINICGHYRHFFRKYGIDTTFFIYSLNSYSEIYNKIVPDFNYCNINALSGHSYSEMIFENLSMLSTIIKYIPRVYYIQSNIFEPVVHFKHMIKTSLESNNNIAHIILSKDPSMFQLCNISDMVSVIRTKPRDSSYIVSKDTLINKYLEFERKVKTRSEIISPELFSIILATSPYKCMSALVNINSVIKNLEFAISNRRITNGYPYDIGSVLNLFKNYNYEEMHRRFGAVDLKLLYGLYVNKYKAYMHIDSYITDIQDADSVNNLNNFEFKDYPIDVMSL